MRSLAQTTTQTTPDSTPKFSIGSAGSVDEIVKLSPKSSRKDRSVKQSRSKRERITSPSTISFVGEKSSSANKEKIKEAMSPSVAECMRAIFAAFLWHEGIVHDAMACASFLKFHPDLTKLAAFQVRPDIRERSKPEAKLTKEQKARQRHSVEVSAYNYLNVIPQNTEDFFRPSSNATNMNEVSRAEADPLSQTKDKEFIASWIGYQSSPAQKLATVMESASSCNNDLPELPLVLRHVVLLWEELNLNCMKAVSSQMVLQSPSLPSKNRKVERSRDKMEKEKKHKHKKKSASAAPPVNIDAPSVDDFFNSQDCASHCDLCGKALSPQHPQDHFFANHPGCKAPSHGCGYVGGRWKLFSNRDHFDQPCGISVRGCYHLCWSCRHKYKSDNAAGKSSKESSSGNSRKSKRKTATISSLLLSPMGQQDTHLIMRNNAMFLLDLASAASTPVLPQRTSRRSLPPGITDLSPDSSPFPQVVNNH